MTTVAGQATPARSKHEPSPEIVARFWGKLDPLAGPDDCWPWPGCRWPEGYGQTWDGARVVRTHRFAWEIATGRTIPEGMQINHHCDNRPCCNPDHLYLGTHDDNMRDMWGRGRGRLRSGENHWAASITAVDARTIRERYAAGGVKQRQLADEYGTTKAVISKVVCGDSWAEAGGPIKAKPKRLTVDEIIAIREARAAGAVQKRLAETYGVHRTTIYQIVNGILSPEVGGPLVSRASPAVRTRVPGGYAYT